MTNRQSFLAYLQLATWPKGQRGLHYRGPADFLLQHGRWYSPTATNLEYLTPHICYGNAIIVAVRWGWPYVEGWAVNFQGVPIHHAWNAHGDSAVDVTWRIPGVIYFGVEFSAERADDCTWNGDATVLDDFNRGWPLLRKPWTGEDKSIVWPPSDRLEALRTGDRAALARCHEEVLTQERQGGLHAGTVSEKGSGHRHRRAAESRSNQDR
jgi:hypothetical protein